MSKTDITHKIISISYIKNVIKSCNTMRGKLLHNHGRQSDAFVYIISGCCDYRFNDGTEFTASAGNIIYLAQNSVYTMRVKTDAYISIYCDFEFCDKCEKKSGLYSSDNTEAENMFRKLYNIYKHPDLSSAPDCMSILYSIYGIIMKLANRPYSGSSAKAKADMAKNYIDISYNNQSLTVSAVAQQLDISEVYLRKLFKERYSISPSRYIISMRIKQAQELMKYSFLSLEECALQSGFSSLEYFCRTFKKETGISPGKYRAQNYNH